MFLSPFPSEQYPKISSLSIYTQGSHRQFFLGPALLITPVLAQGATTVNGVFPGSGGKGEVYYDWYTHSAQNISTPGANVTIDAPLGHIPIYIRGGYIIPTQEPALVIRDARRNPWGVIAALSLEGTASGNLYVDDGESVMQNGTLFVEVCIVPSLLSIPSCVIPSHPTLSHPPLRIHTTPQTTKPPLNPSTHPTSTSLTNLVHRLQQCPLRLRPRHLQRHQRPRERHCPRRAEHSQ